MKKILAVDDSNLILRIVSNAAAVIGAECQTARDGLEALARLEEYQGQFDLITLDWNMPNMNGYDCLVAIRADSRWKDIPILMLTTEAGHQCVVDAIKAGATSYLTKPFAYQDLELKMLDCMGLNPF